MVGGPDMEGPGTEEEQLGLGSRMSQRALALTVSIHSAIQVTGTAALHLQCWLLNFCSWILALPLGLRVFLILCNAFKAGFHTYM